MQAWDAVAPTEFSTNRRLRTHIPDITHPTLYSTDAPFTMLGMGCLHSSFHNSYPVAAHDIPNPPIVTEEGFAAAGYRQYDRIIPEDLWARLVEPAKVELNPSILEEVDLQAPGEGGGRYQTTVSSVPHWLPDDLWQAVLALLGFSLPPLQGLEALCPRIIERWEAEPWKGFQIPHRDFALSVEQSVQCMVVFIPLTTSPPSKSLKVCPGTQGGYHAANRWDIVIQLVVASPPPEATDFCRVRCTAGTVVYSFAALGAALVREPGAGRMAWMAMAHFTPPLSSQDAEMLDLVRVDKARRTICSCSEKVCPRGALHARDVVTPLGNWPRFMT